MNEFKSNYESPITRYAEDTALVTGVTMRIAWKPTRAVITLSDCTEDKVVRFIAQMTYHLGHVGYELDVWRDDAFKVIVDEKVYED